MKVVLLSPQSLKLESENDTSVWVSLRTTKVIEIYSHLPHSMKLEVGLGNIVVLESGCFMTCTLG